mgnify:CR=1 FL=1
MRKRVYKDQEGWAELTEELQELGLGAYDEPPDPRLVGTLLRSENKWLVCKEEGGGLVGAEHWHYCDAPDEVDERVRELLGGQ